MPGPSTVGFGGNSSCVEINGAGETMIFDAGTGIIALGRRLEQSRQSSQLHLFISHTHHDHIEGLRFFEPIYRSHWHCNVYGSGHGDVSLAKILNGAMKPGLFPVSLSELSCRLTICELDSGKQLEFGGNPGVTVTVRHSAAHPKIGVNLYRISSKGRSVVYATDVEAAKGGREDVVDLAHGTDVLIHDAQYTDDEYNGGQITKAGWGHSTIRQAAEAAREAQVGELILYHHDPSHDDDAVRELEAMARKIFPRSRAAYEGLEIDL